MPEHKDSFQKEEKKKEKIKKKQKGDLKEMWKDIYTWIFGLGLDGYRQGK